MAYHGYNPIQADEDFALPSATTGYSDDFRYQGKTNGRERVLVIANTAISIASAQALSIEFMAGATANPTANPKAENHTYLVHKTSADGILAYSAGDVIVDFTLPEALLNAGDYWRLLFTDDANESAELVDILHVGQI